MFSALVSIGLNIRNYYHQIFFRGLSMVLLVMLGLLIYSSYFLQISIRQSLVLPLRLCWDFSLYFFPTAFIFLLQGFVLGKQAHLKNLHFWLLLGSAAALFTWRVNTDIRVVLAPGISDHFALTILNMITRSLILVAPIVSYWYTADKNNQPLYGFRSMNVRPFGWMLLLMLPLLMLVSTQLSFLATYPRVIHGAGLNIINQPISAFIFEIFYAFDFISIEFFFRGFLVLAFTRFCGIQAILPAACFYCCIHLDKPLAEAISSFFGGLILGVVSYYCRSIWGGVLVHIGIAWLMELLTFPEQLS